MHITRIELENIKSHAHFSQEFQRGTTAIVGENGAGKTTIIEAVAWTLFDLLDYRKEDFLRRGEKKGSARVTFESSHDERRYTVYRDTATGYYVFDPELKIRIADKKDEVSRFLWQHLGVDAGTDLEVLFRTAIGVPQGTFTAVFLDTVSNRKKAFDKLLKVDEYRFGSDKLRETSRFVELKIVAVREKIARAEGELARFDAIETELEQFREQASQLAGSTSSVEREVAAHKTAVGELDANEARVIALKTEFDAVESARSKAEFVLGRRELELKAAQEAAGRVKAVEADSQAYVTAAGMIRELERERVERDKIREAISSIENAKSRVIADQHRFAAELDRIQNARAAIAELKPKSDAQGAAEKDRDELRAEIARREPLEQNVSRLDKRLADLRDRFAAQRELVKDLTARSTGAENLDGLERQSAELTKKVADYRAQLDADERFQREIKNGLCPVLSEKCLNLKPGQTLDGFVSSKFTEIRAEILLLENENAAVGKGIAAARDAKTNAAKLEVELERQSEIEKEGGMLRAERDEAAKILEDLPALRERLASADARVRELGNPTAELIAAESIVGRESDVRNELSEVERNLERLESNSRIEVERLESYKDLDSNWAAATAERDRTEIAHREYLANEALAKSVAEKERSIADSIAELEKIKTVGAKVTADFAAAEKDYDRERHQLERSKLFEAEKRLAETRANLANAERRVAELDADIARLSEVRREMQAEVVEKERLEKIYDATEFIRATLKKSAPLVARNYVYHVSLEAAQMFREITGNPERNLRWTEDYSIVLEEGGYDRPFAVLSGGEQMAAALAVRLALLKQLSEIRLAFFDEPTTNMDATRRERLAEQINLISQRKTFDQLFVISHDDTFESFADSVVTVGDE